MLTVLNCVQHTPDLRRLISSSRPDRSFLDHHVRVMRVCGSWRLGGGDELFVFPLARQKKIVFSSGLCEGEGWVGGFRIGKREGIWIRGKEQTFVFAKALAGMEE